MGLAENLAAIQERIRGACARSGRRPEEIALMAVSKGQPPEAIAEAAELGLTLFGENKVQEAKAKIGRCPGRIHWQMIGHLQSNKCRDAVHLFEMIQSVDSLDLAMELQRCAEKSSRRVQVLLEVNVAGEASKFGYAPAALRRELPQLNELDRLSVCGLMTIAPWSQDPGRVRPFFRQLRELKLECDAILGAPMAHLSMGMSGDFEVAIEEGSTMVRIGTALFGPRRPRVNVEN